MLSVVKEVVIADSIGRLTKPDLIIIKLWCDDISNISLSKNVSNMYRNDHKPLRSLVGAHPVRATFLAGVAVQGWSSAFPHSTLPEY